MITEPGKRGIQDRTEPGEPPPNDCILKNCTGKEWQDLYLFDMSSKKNISNLDKKKDTMPGSDGSLKTGQNEKAGEKKDPESNWFNSWFD